MRTIHERFEPVLGTVLEVQARIGRRSAARVMPALVAEIERLEAIFSVFQSGSELCRWRVGPTSARVSTELAALLAGSLALQQASAGVYNPAIGALSALWKDAEAKGEAPESETLHSLAADLRAPRYRVDGCTVEMLGDCSQLNFNAFAKGLVVDLACEHVVDVLEPDMMLVNIGGDLRHIGSGGVAVGVENPLRPFDNEPSLTRVIVRNAAAATSGLARRGYRIQGRWYSHVIDPRSGWPVDAVASSTVIAPTAAQADGIATVLSVLPPNEGIAYSESYRDVAAFVVAADGACSANDRWASLQG